MVSARTKPGLGISQNLTVETDEASRGNLLLVNIFLIIKTCNTMKNNRCLKGF